MAVSFRSAQGRGPGFLLTVCNARIAPFVSGSLSWSPTVTSFTRQRRLPTNGCDRHRIVTRYQATVRTRHSNGLANAVGNRLGQTQLATLCDVTAQVTQPEVTPAEHLVTDSSFRGIGYTVALCTRSVLFRVRRRVRDQNRVSGANHSSGPHPRVEPSRH